MGTVVAFVVAALAGLASLVAMAKANFAKTTIATQKDSNEALKERVQILESEVVRLETQDSLREGRIRALETENATLRTYVSGTEAIKELALTLAASDRVRAGEHHDILAAIQLIPTVVTSSHTEVMALLRSHTHAEVT